MADPTDRQRAEAKARELWPAQPMMNMIANALLEAEQRARREGWEAGREDAAKACEGHLVLPAAMAAIIRALPTPEEK